jgi:N-acetylmuramoyl-L-alanine amidase
MWVEAKKLAAQAIRGRLHDMTKGATYYHTGSIKPAWEKQVTLTKVIGHHRFYRWKADMEKG